MSDLELTELCALAMGWQHLGAVGVMLPPDVKNPSDLDERFKGKLWCLSGGNDWWIDPEGRSVCAVCSAIPDPLNNDAHAMALVRRHPIRLTPHLKNDYSIEWCCESVWPFWKNGYLFSIADSPARAIVKCVARMQQDLQNA